MGNIENFIHTSASSNDGLILKYVYMLLSDDNIIWYIPYLIWLQLAKNRKIGLIERIWPLRGWPYRGFDCMFKFLDKIDFLKTRFLTLQMTELHLSMLVMLILSPNRDFPKHFKTHPRWPFFLMVCGVRLRIVAWHFRKFFVSHQCIFFTKAQPTLNGISSHPDTE